MVSKGDRVVVLYPIYFDASRSRQEGRRVRRDLAISNPTLEEVVGAAKRLNHRVEEDKASHPTRHWKEEGRVLILGGGKKTKIVEAVAREMKAHRS